MIRALPAVGAWVAGTDQVKRKVVSTHGAEWVRAEDVRGHVARMHVDTLVDVPAPVGLVRRSTASPGLWRVDVGSPS